MLIWEFLPGFLLSPTPSQQSSVPMWALARSGPSPLDSLLCTETILSSADLTDHLFSSSALTPGVGVDAHLRQAGFVEASCGHSGWDATIRAHAQLVCRRALKMLMVV